MKIARMTGLPGDGKSTLLSAIVKEFENSGYIMAAVVNDIGHINIDQMVVASDGIVTKEMSGGCICCGTESTFNTTMINLYMTHHPDMILIEPADIAASYEIGLGVIAASRSGLMLENAPVVMVMDPRRMNEHLAHVPDLLKTHVLSADIVFVGMSESAEGSEMDGCEDIIRSIDPDVHIIRGSAKTGDGFHELTEALMSGTSKEIDDIDDRLAAMESGNMDATETEMHRLMDGLGKFSAVLKMDSSVLGVSERSSLIDRILQNIEGSCRMNDAHILHLKVCMYSEGERDDSEIIHGDIAHDGINVHDGIVVNLVKGYLMVHAVVHGTEDSKLKSVILDVIDRIMRENDLKYRLLREFLETEKRVK